MARPGLYIGVDAGGSKTELCLQSVPQGAVRSLTGGAANLQRLGVDATADALAELIGAACRDEQATPPQVVCVGVAGAGRASDQEALTRALRARLHDLAPAHLTVVDDGTIALEAAFEGEGGTIVVAGTGSIVLARAPDGSRLRAGGWGYLLGDEGSGYALGRLALQAVAASFDGGPTTRLTRQLATHFGIDTPEALIRRVYHEAWALQHVAPLLIAAAESGDEASQRILLDQTQALARRVRWLAERAPGLPPRYALLGGLASVAAYRQALLDAIRSELPDWVPHPPRHTPAEGALRLALHTAPEE